MTGAVSLLFSALLVGCGGELTDLIPKQDCVDAAVYPGGGLHTSNISEASGLALNGDASVVDGVLRVAPASRNAAGSAFFSEPISLSETTNLSAHFALRVGGGDLLTGADGMAFLLQSSTQGASALGLDGGGLGYQNVSPSWTVEFDPFQNPPDPPGPHVALMRDGDINNGLVAYAAPNFALNDGVTRNIWVDYQASSRTLSVYMSDSPDPPADPLLITSDVDLAGSLGAQVYAGFSASAGERFNDHDVVGQVWVVPTALPKCR